MSLRTADHVCTKVLKLWSCAARGRRLTRNIIDCVAFDDVLKEIYVAERESACDCDPVCRCPCYCEDMCHCDGDQRRREPRPLTWNELKANEFEREDTTGQKEKCLCQDFCICLCSCATTCDCDNQNHAVNVYNLDGACRRTFGLEKLHMEDSRYAAMHVDGELQLLLATDMTRQRVHVYRTSDGFLIRAIGFKGGIGGRGILSAPRGIAMHRHTHHIFVCDRSGLVQVFNKDGAFLFQFGGGYLQDPMHLAIDYKTDEVWVSDGGFGCIWLFSTTGQLRHCIQLNSDSDDNFHTMEKIAVHAPTSHIVVHDCTQSKVLVFRRDGTHVQTLATGSFRGGMLGLLSLGFNRVALIDQSGYVCVKELHV